MPLGGAAAVWTESSIWTRPACEARHQALAVFRPPDNWPEELAGQVSARFDLAVLLTRARNYQVTVTVTGGYSLLSLTAPAGQGMNNLCSMNNHMPQWHTADHDDGGELEEDRCANQRRCYSWFGIAKACTVALLPHPTSLETTSKPRLHPSHRQSLCVATEAARVPVTAVRK